jgi:hypothetical protein
LNWKRLRVPPHLPTAKVVSSIHVTSWAMLNVAPSSSMGKRHRGSDARPKKRYAAVFQVLPRSKYLRKVLSVGRMFAAFRHRNIVLGVLPCVHRKYADRNAAGIVRVNLRYRGAFVTVV